MNKDRSKSKKTFICYASEDRSTVIKIYNRLKRDGFDPWIDVDKLLAGQEWGREIRKAIRNSDYVIVCLSKKSIDKSGFVHKEIKDALDVADEQPEGKIFLIPLKLEECTVPDRLGHLMWVNYFEEFGHEKLLHALGRPNLPLTNKKKKYLTSFVLTIILAVGVSIVIYYSDLKLYRDSTLLLQNHILQSHDTTKTKNDLVEGDTSETVVKRNAALAKAALTELVQFYAELMKNASTQDDKAKVRSDFANKFLEMSSLPQELNESYIDYMLHERKYLTEQEYVLEVIGSAKDMIKVNAGMRWLKEKAFEEMKSKK